MLLLTLSGVGCVGGIEVDPGPTPPPAQPAPQSPGPDNLTHLQSKSLLQSSGQSQSSPQAQPLPQPSLANVTVLWSFDDGNTCSSLGGRVSRIHLEIPGQALDQSDFGCTLDGSQGVIYEGFAPGSYSIEVSAFDAANQLLYSGSSPFTVSGDVVVSVGLAAPYQPQTGTVSLYWTFADGSTCASLGGALAGIQVSIPGQSLANGGYFPCQTSGVQGIALMDFAPGAYTYSLSGLDRSGGELYQGSGSFVVSGDTEVSSYLVPSVQPGDVQLAFRFADGNTCDTLGAEVYGLQVTVPGQSLANGGYIPCYPGSGQVADLGVLAAGSYSFSVAALDASGATTYQAQGSFSVNGSVQVSTVLLPVETAPAGSTLQLRWSFLDANQSAYSCAELGVDSVQVTIGNSAPMEVPCSANGVDGADFSGLAPGAATVSLAGLVGAQSPVVAYWAQTSVSLPAQGVVQVGVALQPTDGQLDLTFDLGGLSCDEAGLSDLAFSVQSPSGEELSGYAPGQTIACQGAGGTLHWDHFQPGPINIRVSGFTPWGEQTWGFVGASSVVAGAANATQATLLSCGTPGSGC